MKTIILFTLLICGIVYAGDITVSFDVASRQLVIATNEMSAYSCDLSVGIIRHGMTVPFADTSFGFSAATNGIEFVNKTWPPEGLIYVSTDQDILERIRISWIPESIVTLDFWLLTSGQQYSTNLVVTIPRPAQPYPSWTWVDGLWTAPVSYPVDGEGYIWDEESQAWINQETP